jgi:predicted small metal-binding protein
MKQFSCGDVVPGCNRAFRGSEQEILAAVSLHAQADHGMIEIPASVVDQVRSHIVSV